MKLAAVTGSECAGSTFKHLPVLTSQTLTVSSKEPETIMLDWGLKLTQKTWLVWPCSVLMREPVSTSQRRTVLSSEAEQTWRESEEKARSEMPWSWPWNSWRVEKSPEVDQVRRVLSAEEEPKRRPSEENLTAETARLWAVRVCLSL